MIIQDGLSSRSAAILFMIAFMTIIIYLLVTLKACLSETKHLKQAKRLIEEGHHKALHGKKDDGFYQENRRTKTPEDIEACKKYAEKVAEQDISLLS